MPCKKKYKIKYSDYKMPKKKKKKRGKGFSHSSLMDAF